MYLISILLLLSSISIAKPKLVQISGGEEHSCGLTNEGKAYCWGSNSFGQLGSKDNEDKLIPTEILGLGKVSHIEAGKFHSCAIAKGNPKNVYCWGRGRFGQL